MADFLADIKVKLPGSKEDCRIEIDGQIKYISITATVRKTWNSTTNISGIVIDVTTQKLHENRLKQYTAELKRSNEDLEQFAYVASHDLQEPLRKIRAFGDLLTSRYKTQLDVPGADYIQRMQSGAARMQVLIEDLLAFSRVTRLNVLFESLDVNAILAEVIDDIDLQVKRENAAIMVRNIPSFEGDRGQIKRLFQNLVSNAIKFHKRGEQPVVEVGGQLVSKKEAEAELSVVLTGLKYVRIFVKDNGIGFDEQYSERIFNIFQRLHGRMEYEGTGIGLAICRKIVANHGGYITAHSKENAGSEFIIILPVN
jgi:light-regulated signal transduction histidine kinase (bacteriophytochrome)